jgi:hypothetical protein
LGFEDPAVIYTNFKPWPHAYNTDLKGMTEVPMMLYETTLSNSLPHVWLESMTQSEKLGSIFVAGYDNLTMVPFTAWYDGPNGTSAHVNVPSTGHTWTNLPEGSYTVYSTYNSNTTSKTAQVVADKASTVTFVFSGPAPNPTEETGFPILEVTLVAVAVAVGASALTYFLVKRRSSAKE